MDPLAAAACGAAGGGGNAANSSFVGSFAGVLDLAFAGGAESLRALLGARVGLIGARVGLTFCSGGATIAA